jgi:hypothetical protein
MNISRGDFIFIKTNTCTDFLFYLVAEHSGFIAQEAYMHRTPRDTAVPRDTIKGTLCSAS